MLNELSELGHHVARDPGVDKEVPVVCHFKKLLSEFWVTGLIVDECHLSSSSGVLVPSRVQNRPPLHMPGQAAQISQHCHHGTF